MTAERIEGIAGMEPGGTPSGGDTAHVAVGAGGPEEPLDPALAAALRAGSHDALETVFDRYVERVHQHCFRRTASWSLAEDATSTVFLEAWRCRARATAYDDSLLPWLLGIATNVCRNLTRSQRRLRLALGRVPAPGPAPDHADDVVARLDDERRMAAVLAALTTLPRRDQDVLSLVDWSGLTYDTAAAALGVPVGTVRSRLSRARSRLADRLDPKDTP